MIKKYVERKAELSKMESITSVDNPHFHECAKNEKLNKITCKSSSNKTGKQKSQKAKLALMCSAHIFRK